MTGPDNSPGLFPWLRKEGHYGGFLCVAKDLYSDYDRYQRWAFAKSGEVTKGFVEGRSFHPTPFRQDDWSRKKPVPESPFRKSLDKAFSLPAG
jgi:hypothetical protein